MRAVIRGTSDAFDQLRNIGVLEVGGFFLSPIYELWRYSSRVSAQLFIVARILSFR